jgi:HK97 family phage prohead protease
MKLTFSTPIQASDTERRIISGKVMEYGAVGQTSAGPVVFEHGSIEIPSAAKIKLLAQHEPNNPIGRAQSFSTEGDFMYGTFKISNSSKGTDYLTLAAEDLVSGLSVGVEVISSLPKDNYLLVTAARMMEVSLVESPAFQNATVTKVAASESAPENNPTNQPTESEAVMTTAPETPAPENEEAAAPVVEASRPVVTASYIVGEVRSPIKTKAQYLEHTIKAQLGNDQSRDYVRAADAQAQKIEAANDSFTTNPAFSPVQYVSTVVDTLIGSRPTIDACGGAKALPASGMTVSIPKITTSSTVASTPEAGAPSSTGIVSSYVNATVTKYAGIQTYSVEILERADPSFFQAMLSNMQKAYNKATDAAVIAEITSGGTLGTGTTADSAGLISFISTDAPKAYLATADLATAFVSGTSVWSLLLGATDTTGRPIYNASMPMNAGGSSVPTSLRGNVLGLDYYADSNMVATTIDDSSFIIVPSAIAIYESPVLKLSTNIPASGEISTMLYGYMAVKTLVSGGLRRFNLT